MRSKKKRKTIKATGETNKTTIRKKVRKATPTTEKKTTVSKKSKKTSRKKKRRRRLIRKLVFAIKLIILVALALILLALLAIAILWTIKYGKVAADAIYRSLQAWHNFFTYLKIPQEVYARIIYWSKIIGGIVAAAIFLGIILSLLSKLKTRKNKKSRFTHKKTKNIAKETNTSPSENTNSYDQSDNIIVLGKDDDIDIIDIDQNSARDNSTYLKESPIPAEDKNTTMEDNVIILGPKGREIAEVSWDDDEVIYPEEKQSLNNTPKTDDKVIPLGKRTTNEKKKIRKVETRREQKREQGKHATGSGSSPLTLISEIEPDYLNKVRPEAERNAEVILELLHNFGIKGEINEIQIGPRVSRYEITIPKGTRVDKIKKLSSDIATALGVRDVRIETTVPGKPMAVAIEVPNSIRGTVHIGTIVRSSAFKNIKTPTPLVLGLDVTGRPIVEDLRKQPHLLIAGATGSGKSVCINTILTGMLLKTPPKDLRLMLVDPKRVELTPYSSLPHLLFPILTEANEAVAGLEWMIREMNRRYRLLKEHGVRSIDKYNAQIAEEDEKLPYIVVVIDELADLMMVASSETEQKIARLAQLARAAGIHLILATQRPSTDVITGLIKANIPARIAFAVSSQIDSRVILDTTGAEKLLGMGDMLFVSPKYRHPIRIQGAYTPDEDINAVVDYWARRYPQEFEELNLMELTSSEKTSNGKSGSTYDPLLKEAWRLIVEHNRPSASFLQRKLRVGFNRASRILEELEELGVVSPPEGPQGKRKILRTDYDSDIG